MKWLAGFLVVLALGFFVLALKKPQARHPASHNFQSEQVVNRIMENSKRDLAEEAYQRNVQKAQTSQQLASVAYFCLESYHRDSCLHHLISCGQRCRALLPQDKFAKINNDYWALMRLRGLAKGP